VVAWRGPHTVPTGQPIVVGTDSTPSSIAALDAAFEFADRFTAKLSAVKSWSMRRLAAAVTIPFLVDWDGLEAAEWIQLTDVVDRHNKLHPDVTASCFVETTESTAALLHQVELDGAQLVVIGSRGRGALSSAMLGSTGLSLLHHAKVPVMICRSPGES
jgi:nucleotide-binding universal stress UspA family protein